jgi:hypothetical protein
MHNVHRSAQPTASGFHTELIPQPGTKKNRNGNNIQIGALSILIADLILASIGRSRQPQGREGTRATAYTLEGSSIFGKFLTTLTVRSVTSPLSRNDPLESSDDIQRRPHSAATGLTEAADGAAGTRRCLRSRLLAAAAAISGRWAGA